MKISITDSAAQHFSKMLAKRGNGLGIRIGVKNSGCAQYAYIVDFADKENPVVQNDYRIFCCSNV